MIETERALPVCCVWMIHGAWMINCLSLNFLIRTLNFQSWNFNQDYGLRTLIFQNSSHFDWQEFKELLKAQISKSSSQFVNSVTSSNFWQWNLLGMRFHFSCHSHLDSHFNSHFHSYSQSHSQELDNIHSSDGQSGMHSSCYYLDTNDYYATWQQGEVIDIKITRK